MLSRFLFGVIFAVLVVIPSRHLPGQVTDSLAQGERIYAKPWVSFSVRNPCSAGNRLEQ